MAKKKISKSRLLDQTKLHFFGISMIFHEFIIYNDLIENKFIEEKENRKLAFDKYFNEEAEKGFEFGYDLHLIDGYIEDYWQIDKFFPHSFRASLLIQIFSFIEFELKEICNHHQFHHSVPFNISDLKGSSDIDKAKLYLSKACNISFAELDPEWGFIKLIQKIRNKLVHHQGLIMRTDPDWKEISGFVDKNCFIEFKEDEFKKIRQNLQEEFTLLIVGKELNELLIEKTKTFFTNLLEKKLKPEYPSLWD